MASFISKVLMEKKREWRRVGRRRGNRKRNRRRRRRRGKQQQDKTVHTGGRVNEMGTEWRAVL